MPSNIPPFTKKSLAACYNMREAASDLQRGDDTLRQGKRLDIWAAPTRDRGRLLAHALVFGAALFNAVLCLIATRGAHIGLPIIAGTEMALVAGALLLALPQAINQLAMPALLAGSCVVALYLFAPGLDIKMAVDLAIIAGFVACGRRYGDRASARRMLLWLAGITLVMGLYEMFALDSFEHWFHVYDYYVGKGDLDAAHASDTGTLLAENGVRPGDQGRQLMGGLLGLHRAGSIFLEPISAGNFGVICALFAVAVRGTAGARAALALIGLAIGVLADARFAILSATAIWIFLGTPFWRNRLVVALLPAAALVLLMVLGGLSHHEVDNSVIGRLTGSGQLLDDWSIWQWLGLSADRAVSMDTGYSYVIGNLGLPVAAAVWVVGCMVVPRTGETARYFAGATVYVALSLCISASCLSIKTGAALWFVLGALWQQNVRDSRAFAAAPKPAGRRG